MNLDKMNEIEAIRSLIKRIDISDAVTYVKKNRSDVSLEVSCLKIKDSIASALINGVDSEKFCSAFKLALSSNFEQMKINSGVYKRDGRVNLTRFDDFYEFYMKIVFIPRAAICKVCNKTLPFIDDPLCFCGNKEYNKFEFAGENAINHWSHDIFNVDKNTEVSNVVKRLF